SPTARALVRLGKALGYDVHAIDPNADRAAFPEADGIVTDATSLALDRARAPLFAAVATQGEWADAALRPALAQAPDYAGGVASATPCAEAGPGRAGRAEGAAPDSTKTPAGLDLGSQLPEAIALGILAQIVKERHRAVAEHAPAPSAAEVTGSANATEAR